MTGTSGPLNHIKTHLPQAADRVLLEFDNGFDRTVGTSKRLSDCSCDAGDQRGNVDDALEFHGWKGMDSVLNARS